MKKVIMIVAVSCIALLTNAGEFNIGGSGVYSDHKGKLNDAFDKGYQNGEFGYALESSYFFKPNFGIAGDLLVRNATHLEDSYFDSASLSGVVKGKVWKLEPFALAGVGRDFQHGEYTTHVGVGVGVPVYKNVSLVTQLRYEWAVSSEYSNAQIRMGISTRF